MPLAVGARADGHRDRAVLVDLDRAVLGMEPERGGDLDVGGDTDAELHGIADSPTVGLLSQQLLVAGGSESGVERLGVLARIVGARP